MIFLEVYCNISREGREISHWNNNDASLLLLSENGVLGRLVFQLASVGSEGFIEVFYSVCSLFLRECGKCKHQSGDLEG